MISFILLALFITAIAVLMLVWPLFRPVDSDSYERHTQNIHFARERLKELEQQLSDAKITADDYEELKLEIETTLANDIDLADSERTQAEESRQSSSNAVVITLLCCLVPISAFILYLLTGTPSAVNNTTVQSTASTATAVTTNNPAAGAEISDLVKSLEQRLNEQPGDAKGWAVLARTYQQLGRYDEAVAAYQQLEKLDENNADTYAGLADASALQAGGILTGAPSEYVQKALLLNPQHPQALWLAGLAQAQIGQRLEAINYWERLLPLLSEFPQQQAELSDVIAQTKSASESGEADLSNEQAANSALTDQAQSSTSTGSQSEGISISVNVSLSEQIISMTSPSDTVFVFARAKQGPPAPLAVKRLTVGDLPVAVTLSEADAMMPQLTLAQFEEVVLSARVAKSGNPIAQAGDIQSQTIEIRNDIDTPISLTIENIIE